MEKTVSPEIFLYFFIKSDTNLTTQTQILNPKLPPNLTLTKTQAQTLI